MQKRRFLHLILALAVAGTAVPARALTQDELVAKLQAAGYANVSDVKSTAEGTTAKAMRNGKPVKLVIDSSGQVKEQD
ncbi:MULTISPECIES: PepSY domain-containing protein [Bradyrhizobium]|uniref:PepSY domain-containing protein n=1 Tax=Bradyrhizobium embrapense TaxID=630921 RepID=UPI00067B1352|nr:PepSY domain-containing protein [Bradyrhizobium embrapense]